MGQDWELQPGWDAAFNVGAQGRPPGMTKRQARALGAQSRGLWGLRNLEHSRVRLWNEYLVGRVQDLALLFFFLIHKELER